MVLVAHLLGALANVFLTAILIRAAGNANYGAYILISSVATILLGISSLGVGFRYKRTLPAAYGNAVACRHGFYPQFYFQLAVTAFLAGCAWLARGYLAKLLLEPGIELAAWIIPSFLVVYLLFTQASDYFRYSLRMELAMLLSLLQPYGHILLIWIFWRLQGSVSLTTAFAAFGIATLASTAPFLWKITREIDFDRPRFDRTQLREDIRLGFPLILSFLADFALSATARYVLAIRLNLEAVAWFSAAYTIANTVSVFPRVTGTVLPALMSRAFDSEQPADAHKTIVWSLRIFFMLSIPFVVGSFVLGHDALVILGNAALADRAWLMIPILALGTLFYGLNIILNNVLFVILKTGLLFRISLIASGLNLALCVVGLLLWPHAIVVAIAQLVSYLVSFIFFRNKVRKLWPVNFDRTFIMKACVASLVMGGVVFLARLWLISRASEWTVLISCTLFGTLIYGLFMVAMRAMQSELDFISKYASRFRSRPKVDVVGGT